MGSMDCSRKVLLYSDRYRVQDNLLPRVMSFAKQT